MEVPDEFILCLQDEPVAWQHFQQFTESEKKKYTDWIYSAKTETTKAERMAEAVNNIMRGEKR